MLSIAPVRSAAGSAQYFAEDNYYSIGEGTENSVWYGEGAGALGLDGKVSKEAFEKVLSGIVSGGTQVGTPGNRRLGLDLTFSASKSASVLALVGKDQRLIDAFGQSVKDALKFVEDNLIQSRTEQGGRFVPTDSKKLVAALFTHDTSRAQEPGLHIHAIIANMTQGKDGQWRALHNEKIWEYQSLIGNVQAAYFRDAVEKLGYQTERTGKHGQFEILGVPQEVKDAFSTRRAEIMAKAKELGINSAAGRDAITIATRQNKDEVVDREAMTAKWDETAKSLGFDPKNVIDKSYDALRGPSFVQSVMTSFIELRDKLREWLRPKDSLFEAGIGYTAKTSDEVKHQLVTASAIRIKAEREAGFERMEVVRAALSLDVRGITAHGVLARIEALKAKGEVVEGIGVDGGKITTAFAIKRERNILAQVELGRGQVKPAYDVERAFDVLTRVSASRPLNEGQLEAAIKILSSPDRIIAVQGIAGAGKSTMFASVVAALEEARVGVRGTAFANKMVNDLKNGSAIDSQTVASFLLENEHFIDGQRGDAFEAKKEHYAGTTLLLDEASLVSNAQMEGLTIAANIFEFEKLAIVGDKAQLSAIEAGKPQALLEANGIEIAYMNTNLRQRTPLMIKVAALANAGKAKAAISALGSNVIESEERAKAAAELWLSLSKEERAQTAIFTSGKVTRDEINETVQKELRYAGEIGAEVARVGVYERVDRTREELRYAKSYSPGMILDVAVGSRRLGLTKGEYHVREVSEKGIVHLVRDGKTYRFDPQSVPAREKDYGLGLNLMKGIKLSEGDKIRWTAKDKPRGITNASLGTVTSVEDGNITVETPETNMERLKLSDEKLNSPDVQAAIVRYLSTDRQEASTRSDVMIKGIAAGKVEVERHGINRVTLGKEDPMRKRLDLAYALNIHMAQGVTANQTIQVMGSEERFLSTMRQMVVGLTRARDTVWLVTDNAEKLGNRIERNLGNKTSALEMIGESKSLKIVGANTSAVRNWSPDDPMGKCEPSKAASNDDSLSLASLYEVFDITPRSAEPEVSSQKRSEVAASGPKIQRDDPQKIKELDR
jgi:conjugative relaxase-like TrwC/TraI family protein